MTRKTKAWLLAGIVICGLPCLMAGLWFRQSTMVTVEDVVSSFSMNRNGTSICACVGGSPKVARFDIQTLKPREELPTKHFSLVDALELERNTPIVAMPGKSVARKLYDSTSSSAAVDCGLVYPDGLSSAWDGIALSGYGDEPRKFMTVEPGDASIIYRTGGKNQVLGEWSGRVAITGPDYDPISKRIAVGLSSSNDYARDGGPTSWIEVFPEQGKSRTISIDGHKHLARVRWGPKGWLLVLRYTGWSDTTQLVAISESGRERMIAHDLDWEDFVVDGYRAIGGRRSGNKVQLEEQNLNPATFK